MSPNIGPTLDHATAWHFPIKPAPIKPIRSGRRDMGVPLDGQIEIGFVCRPGVQGAGPFQPRLPYLYHCGGAGMQLAIDAEIVVA